MTTGICPLQRMALSLKGIKIQQQKLSPNQNDIPVVDKLLHLSREECYRRTVRNIVGGVRTMTDARTPQACKRYHDDSCTRLANSYICTW